MLRRLTIEEYGLIGRAEIALSSGATVFTGETGSGKTMVLGAIGFVLGGRASADTVRRGKMRALVTLVFEPDELLRQRFARDGFAIDPDEDATISREMTASGKTSLRVNGRAATAGYVRELAPLIVDVVGQHEAQRLLTAAYHVELLDRYAGDEALLSRERVASAYERRMQLARELSLLESDERQSREQHGFAKFALQEIEATAFEPGENERLAQRRRTLDNAEKIAFALRTALEALSGEAGAADSIGSACTALGQIAGISAGLQEMAQSAAGLQAESADLAARLAREADSLEFDPAELETINARIDALETLKRKYGGSIAAVLESAEGFRATIDRFATGDERKAQLARELEQTCAQLEESAAHLSRVRHGAAERLRIAVQSEFKELALGSARFGVTFVPLGEVGPGGAEHAEFVFAANKGEREFGLSKTASGGELSRVLLALVVVLAGARPSTALVFDEIDAGIGGATATAVGARIGRLARGAQLICVTHLAQIASWADAHYVLEKSESGDATTIEVKTIEGADARANEIARMLSGEPHETALAHARTLLTVSGGS